jgi:hypothetical protein
VELTFVAGSEPSGSPTLYRTDRGYWAVQGWVVTDQSALATMDIPPGESCVETPDRLVPFFTTRGPVVPRDESDTTVHAVCDPAQRGPWLGEAPGRQGRGEQQAQAVGRPVQGGRGEQAAAAPA